MNALKDFGMILAPTYRSRAYVQTLRAAGLVPEVAIILPGPEPTWSGENEVRVNIEHAEPLAFLPGETLRTTLAELDTPILHASTADLNQPAFINFLNAIDVSRFVFSGPPGLILRKPILSIGKRFLHAHGGCAPRYSGSTAFYYSLIEQGTIGATVIWLSEELDAGDVVASISCLPPRGIDIDTIVDPILRAKVLVDALKTDRVSSPGNAQDRADREVYYVIHPVLRHLARKKLDLVQSAGHG